MMLAPLLADPETTGWISQILVQFPVVGLVFIAVWWAQRQSDRRNVEFRVWHQDEMRHHREIEDRHAAELTEAVQQLRNLYATAIKELQERVDEILKDHERRQLAELDRLEKSHDEHLKSKNAEIRRLATMLADKRNPEGK